MTGLFLTIAVLLGASAFCSGAEAAIFSISRGQIAAKKSAGDPRAELLEKIKTAPGRPIAAIVILNNIANIVGSIAAGALAAEVFGSAVLGIFSAGLTFLVIFFAEIIPKGLGERHADPVAFFVARPVVFLAKILAPAIWAIEKLSAPFFRGARPAVTSEEEICSLAELGGRHGVIDPHEREMIARVFRLDDVRAEEIMTPRTETVFAPADATLAEVKKLAEENFVTRLPVFEENFDQIIGVILAPKAVAAIAEGRENLTARDLATRAFFVSEKLPANQLLWKFQKTRQHLFVVQDEHGGTAGIVTLENVLEELVGEIKDEADAEEMAGIAERAG